MEKAKTKKLSDDLVVVIVDGEPKILADKKAKSLKTLIAKGNTKIVPLNLALEDDNIEVPIPDGFDSIEEYVEYYDIIHESALDHMSIEQKAKPIVRGHKKLHRNAMCECGSGKKFKNCCMNKSSDK